MRAAMIACLAFCTAIAISVYFLSGLPALLFGALLFVLSCSYALISGKRKTGLSRKKRTITLLLSFGLASGFSLFSLYSFLLVQPAEALVGSTQAVVFRAIDYPDEYADCDYLTVKLIEKNFPSVKCRLSSYTKGELSSYSPGDEFSCSVRFSSSLYRNGECDMSNAAKGILLRAGCKDSPVLVKKADHPLRYFPKKLAQTVIAKCNELFPEDISSFMTALLIGDKTALYDDGNHYYRLRDAGLAHIVAVSGMHISFLVAFIFFLLGRRRFVLLLCIPILILFAAMTGFSPSVSRAVFMQISMLSAPLLRREGDGPTALAIALALLLAVNPYAAAGISLQLSFLSVAGIWFLSSKIFRRISEATDPETADKRSISHQLTSFIGGSVAASLGAMTLTVPLTAVYFGTVSVAAPVSNILCLWLVSLLYCGGYCAVLAGILLPRLGVWIGTLLGWGVRYIYWLTDVLHQIPGEVVFTDNEHILGWLILVYILFFGTWYLRKRSHTISFLFPLFASFAALIGCLLSFSITRTDELLVTALDVGQGASTVLSAGKDAVVVDCGGSRVTRDASEEAEKLLGSQGRRKAAALILTHLHSDHINYAADFLYRVETQDLYLPTVKESDEQISEILEAAEYMGTSIHYLTEDTVLSYDEFFVKIVVPDTIVSDDNESCLMLLISQEDYDVILTGDAPAEMERAFAEQITPLDAELLLVGHHGSAASTCDELLKALCPEHAVISVGYNTYGHPTEIVLSRLAEHNIQVYRTDEMGSITIGAQGDILWEKKKTPALWTTVLSADD